jgi:hypothetical protein
MSPRIIQIPLSGGDRKAQTKGIRHAHGLHETYFAESVLIRSAAEAKIREADRLECEAWNAICGPERVAVRTLISIVSAHRNAGPADTLACY